MDRYIDKYILCPKCKLPEMHMQVVGEKITGKCDSCPFVGDLDSKHKLAAFIIKKPPLAKNMATGKILKVEPEKQTTVTHFGKKEEEKKEEKIEEEVVIFNVDDMDFGSKELEKFGLYIQNYL